MLFSFAMKTKRNAERSTKATELPLWLIEKVESRFPFKLNWADYIRRLIEADNKEIQNETDPS
jgi:hypothetical protein